MEGLSVFRPRCYFIGGVVSAIGGVTLSIADVIDLLYQLEDITANSLPRPCYSMLDCQRKREVYMFMSSCLIAILNNSS